LYFVKPLKNVHICKVLLLYFVNTEMAYILTCDVLSPIELRSRYRTFEHWPSRTVTCISSN